MARGAATQQKVSDKIEPPKDWSKEDYTYDAVRLKVKEMSIEEAMKRYREYYDNRKVVIMGMRVYYGEREDMKMYYWLYQKLKKAGKLKEARS